MSALNSFSSFINTTAGWINLLLLSSSGPVKIPVGAWYFFLSVPNHFNNNVVSVPLPFNL
jgi:hypothetical protein